MHAEMISSPRYPWRNDGLILELGLLQEYSFWYPAVCDVTVFLIISQIHCLCQSIIVYWTHYNSCKTSRCTTEVNILADETCIWDCKTLDKLDNDNQVLGERNKSVSHYVQLQCDFMKTPKCNLHKSLNTFNLMCRFI